MNRRRVRTALAVSIGALLSFVILQVATSLHAQRATRVDRSPLEGMLPQAVQWIQDFRRVEVRDGKKIWEVQAEEAQVLQESGRVVVRRPSGTFYLKDGDAVTVRADDGTLGFQGKDLDSVVLRGNVEIRVRGFTIRSDRARYERTTDRILARGPVQIAGEELTVDGRDMVVFMKEARFVLQEQVRVTLLPQSTKGGRRAS
jgi:LPS export ABC transporter protein LptC